MKKEIDYVVFEDCIECENKLWIFTYQYNALCTLDIEEGVVTYVSSIPNEEFLKKRLVSKIVSYNNDIFLLPMCAKNINIYHVKTNTWSEVEIPNVTDKYNLNYKFMEAVIYGKYLFMIGCSYPGIIQFDLTEQKIIQIIECYSNFSKKEFNSVWIRSNYVKKEKKLYLASCVSNEVLVLDLDNFNYEIISLGSDGNRFSGIGIDNNGFFWLAPLYDTNIVKWNGDKEYKEIPSVSQCNNGFFSGVLICDKIRIFPRKFEGNTVIIDESDNISIINKTFHIYKEINKGYYLCEDFYGNCYIIKNNIVVKKMDYLKINDNSAGIILKNRKVLLGNMVYSEDNLFFKLSNYINSINI